jgi:hypothetical protein
MGLDFDSATNRDLGFCRIGWLHSLGLKPGWWHGGVTGVQRAQRTTNGDVSPRRRIVFRVTNRARERNVSSAARELVAE